MTTPEFTKGTSPLEYLERADREMAAGNGQEAAGLMWQAIEATIVGQAKDKGIAEADLRKMALALDSGAPEEKRWYMDSIVTGVTLWEHAKAELMEEYELELAYELSREFVVGYYGEHK